MTDTTPRAPEFSRPIEVDALHEGPNQMTLSATPNELSALAARFAIVSLESLQVEATLVPLATGNVELQATLDAHLTQSCSVTLQPVPEEVHATFSMDYSPDIDPEGWGEQTEINIDEEETEPSEAIIDGKIDIGEAVAEQLALEINPFPRVQGAEFEGYSSGKADDDEAATEKKNPFAVLSKLKDPKK